MQRRARVDDIITLAARLWQVSREDIISPKRNRMFSRPRQAAFLVAREHGHSYPLIGRVCGNRDHSSVLNGVNQAVNFEERYEDYADKLARLRRLAKRTTPFVAEQIKAVERAAAAISDKVIEEEPEPDPVSSKLERNQFDNSDALFHAEADAEEEFGLGGDEFLERLLIELAKSKLRQEREYI